MDNTAIWVWLQNAFGEGSKTPWYIYRHFPGGVEGFYREGAACWCALKYVTEQQLQALVSFSLRAAEVRLDYAYRMGWWVLTPECEKYPEGLRNISDPPAVLYIKGELGPLCALRPWVALAGARKASPASLEAARRLGHQLALGGAAVVSGMAPGVDLEALQGAVGATGQAVCVMPVDLDSPYHGQSASFRRRLLQEGGVLVSEYFSQRAPAQGTFQQRNRLITGMCQGVLLVQAAEKGGTMLYARHAAKQGRDLFVYPGPPEDPAFAGSRKLLAQGAKEVTSGWQVIESYPEAAYAAGPKAPLPSGGLEESPPSRRKAGAGRKPASARLEAESRPALRDSGPAPVREDRPPDPVLEQLSPDREKTVEELAELTGLEARELLARLARLELEGLAEQVQGKRYRRV